MNSIKNWPEGYPLPQLAEFENEVNNVELQIQKLEYKNNRLAEYPSIGDQLDALWKGGEAADEMLAKVQAVKAKYPKPE